MEVTQWVLHQGGCPDCGRWRKAQVPTAHATGYGPRFSALMGEVAGAYGNGRRIVPAIPGKKIFGKPIPRSQQRNIVSSLHRE